MRVKRMTLVEGMSVKIDYYPMRRKIMYKSSDRVKYKTSTIRTIHQGEIIGQTKTGIIEEAFSTLDNKPCYWILGEKELILQGQIIGGV